METWLGLSVGVWAWIALLAFLSRSIVDVTIEEKETPPGWVFLVPVGAFACFFTGTSLGWALMAVFFCYVCALVMGFLIDLIFYEGLLALLRGDDDD